MKKYDLSGFVDANPLLEGYYELLERAERVDRVCLGHVSAAFQTEELARRLVRPQPTLEARIAARLAREEMTWPTVGSLVIANAGLLRPGIDIETLETMLRVAEIDDRTDQRRVGILPTPPGLVTITELTTDVHVDTPQDGYVVHVPDVSWAPLGKVVVLDDVTNVIDSTTPQGVAFTLDKVGELEATIDVAEYGEGAVTALRNAIQYHLAA